MVLQYNTVHEADPKWPYHFNSSGSWAMALCACDSKSRVGPDDTCPLSMKTEACGVRSLLQATENGDQHLRVRSSFENQKKSRDSKRLTDGSFSSRRQSCRQSWLQPRRRVASHSTFFCSTFYILRSLSDSKALTHSAGGWASWNGRDVWGAGHAIHGLLGNIHGSFGAAHHRRHVAHGLCRKTLL